MAQSQTCEREWGSVSRQGFQRLTSQMTKSPNYMTGARLGQQKARDMKNESAIATTRPTHELGLDPAIVGQGIQRKVGATLRVGMMPSGWGGGYGGWGGALGWFGWDCSMTLASSQVESLLQPLFGCSPSPDHSL